ncbi:MAG: hypothetical protein AAGF92_14660 [Myxococcota bacterium]
MTYENAQTVPMAETISFRAPNGTSDRAERLAKQLAEQPMFAGITFTKSRVYAMAIARGLDILEEEHGTKPKKGRK